MFFKLFVFLLVLIAVACSEGDIEKRSLQPNTETPWDEEFEKTWGAELARSLAAAKEAHNLAQAEHEHVKHAKHIALHRQNLAAVKEYYAAQTAKKKEEAARAARAQAVWAAQAAAHASTELAAAKARAAAAQQVAAAKEAAAAKAIRHAAHMQLATLHNNDVEDTKTYVVQSADAAGAAGAAQHLAASTAAALRPVGPWQRGPWNASPTWVAPAGWAWG